ncbi:hypothetical protein [Streptomyces neyagawaensis]|uniref:Transposase n=1 Tax=Streptomyces neyagawaensis TaxID=42238 RepID=A0ABV3B3F9_9ACTN
MDEISDFLARVTEATATNHAVKAAARAHWLSLVLTGLTTHTRTTNERPAL